MFEGIKVLNAGKEIDLSKFEINVNNEIIIGNLNSLKIYVENGAKYSAAQLQVLENGNDVKIALEDSEGNDIFLILKGLNEILLTNPNELPVFEVFDEGIQLASFVNVEDLDAAAAGGDTTSASQTGDFENENPPSIGNELGESGGNLNGFNRIGNADAPILDQNYQPVVFDVTLSENEILGIHEAGDKNIITGQFLVTDQNPEDTGLHTFSIVEGTVVITSSSGVITQIDDEIEITLNPNGTYEVSGDFNDLALGENATISFDYTATDPRGFESLPATFTLNIVGTNDQPVVEDIDLNNKLGEDFIGYEPFDGSGYLLSFTTNDLGEANFTWSFNTEEISSAKIGFNDFAFYYLLEANFEEINDFPKPSFLFNAEMTNSNGESGEKSTLLSDLTPNTRYFLAFVIADDSDGIVASQFNFLGMDVPFVLIEGEGEVTIKDDNSFILSTGSSNTGLNISELLNNVHGQYDKKIFETSDSNIEDTNENGILRDEDRNNIFKGELSASDDDDTDIHTFHIEEGSLEIEAAVELNDLKVEIKQDESGNWIYEINGDFTNLAEGEKALVTFQYYADDGNIDLNGESNESLRATISLEVTGTNDQPVVQDVDLGTINEATLTNKVFDIAPTLVNPSENDTFFEDAVLSIASSSPSSLKSLSNLQDDDINDAHTFSLANNSNIKVNGQDEIEIEAITINANDIDITINEDGSYSISSEKFNSLGQGESLDISFDYVAIDNSKGLGETNTSEPKTLSFTIEGTNDQPVINNITVSSNNSEHSFKDLVLGEGENQKIYQNGKLQGSLSFDVSDEDINDGHEFVKYTNEPATIISKTYNTDRDDTPADVITEPILVSLNEDGSFEIINKNFDNLGFGESIEISFDVQVSDGTLNTYLGNLTDNEQTRTSEGVLSSNSAISEPYVVTLTIKGSNDKPTVSAIKMGIDTLIYENRDIDENDTSEPQDGILRNDEISNSIKGEFIAFDDDLNDAHTFEVLSMQNGNETVEIYDNRLRKTSEVNVEVSSSDIDSSLIDIKQINLTNNNASSETQDSKTNFELLGDFTSLGAGEKATIKFMYQANDKQNDSSGEASLSEAQIVEIIVTGTNDQPIVEDIILDSKSWYFNDKSTDNLTISGATTEHTTYNGTSWSNGDNHVLNFNGVDERSVIISDLDTTQGGTLSFDFIYGTDYNGGEEVDFLNGDYNPVELHYSKDNGVTWTSYKLFDSSYKDGNWKNISITLENELISEDIAFRLIQLNHSGSSYDHWAIDNLQVGVLNYESNGLKTVLTGELEANDEDINDTVKFETKDLTVTSSDIEDSLIILDGINLSKNEHGDDTKRSAEFELTGDFNALGSGEKAVVTFKYRAVDDSSTQILGESKESEYKTVSITVIGTNDQPIIKTLTYKDTFFEKDNLLSDSNEHSILTGDIDFTAIDVDINDSHEFVSENNIAVKINGEDSSLTASLDSSGTFKINNPSFNNLAAGEKIILTFDVQIKDNSINLSSLDESNISDFKTVTLKIIGTNDQPIVQEVSILNEEENLTKNGLNTIQGTFTTLNIDEDTNDTHKYNILSFDNSTNIEDVVGIDFKRLEDINYDSNGNGIYESNIDIAVKLPTSSEFKLEDIDIKGIEVKGSSFNLIGDFNALPEDKVLTIKFLYNAVDFSKTDALGDNESNTSESKWVTVTIKGTQDDAEISYHKEQNEGFTSEDSVLNTKGKLDIKDADAGEFFEIQNLEKTKYGIFSIDESGYWNYKLDNSKVQFLSEKQEVFDIIVVNSEDGKDSEEIKILIKGENDKPIAVEDSRATIYNENSSWKSFAVLKNDIELDKNDTLSLDDINSITISWADQLKVLDASDINLVRIHNNKVEVNTSSLDFLPKDALSKLEVSYTMSDNHNASSTSTVTFNIKGINDKPSLENDTYSVEESTLFTLSSTDLNNLLSNDKDPDFGDTISIKEFYFAGDWHNVGSEISNSKGATLSVNANGSFTFNQNKAYESLDETQDKSITFKYKVIDSNDGTKIAKATINIDGQNDAPEVINKSFVLFENTATLNLGLSAWDIDDKSLVVSFIDIPNGVTLKNGDLLAKDSIYTVKQLEGLKFNPIENGIFELKYSVSDGLVSTEGNVSLLVQNNLLEDGYTKFDGHYYQNYGIIGSGDISEAINKANEEKGRIVSIQNSEENAFVNSLSPNTDVWLNISDKIKESDWKELDGSEIDGSYENWERGEPNNYGSGEDYVEMHYSTGKWNDIGESGSYRGNNTTIIEKDSNSLEGNADNNTLIYSKDASLINGKEGDDTLIFRETFKDIDFSAVLDGAIKNSSNLHGKEDYTSLQNIELLDLSVKGEHILSNISVEDVIAMSENSTLKIEGSSEDIVNLSNTQWKEGSSSNEYINIANSSLAEGSVKLLIEDDIHVNI